MVRRTKKQVQKLSDKCCFFCHEADYDLLDLHRIIEGKNGGKYTKMNTVTCCCGCHRKIHAGKIKIFGKFLSTKGIVIHFIDEKGNERIE